MKERVLSYQSRDEESDGDDINQNTDDTKEPQFPKEEVCESERTDYSQCCEC